MNETLVPLPVYPFPLAPETRDLMVRAKAELDLPYRLQPVEALPASPGRVLALGALPPHVCEAVLVAPEYVGVYEAIREAMRFALTVPEGALRLVDDGDYLKAMLGAREITADLPVDFDGVVDERGPVAA
jgi:hypothetical protein